MRWITIFFLSCLLCSCFSRYVMTDKELAEYYKTHTPPDFKTIVNDSLKLYCATTGADTLPALLAIHGAPGAWYGSRNLLEDSSLAEHFQIIVIDRPGYNKTRFKDKRKAVTSIELQSKLIVQALQLNRSGMKAVVMGSSYGAPIAARIAIENPELFSHVVMLAPAVDPEKEKFWWFHPLIKGGPLKWMLPRFLRNATSEKYAHIKELKKLEPEWQKLAVPITVVQGGKDEIVDPANFEYAKEQLKGKPAQFIYLPDASHFIRWREPQLVKDILLNRNGILQPSANTSN